jgi:hypothetical protein
MALPTIEEMTNLYLYGTTTRPQNLLSDTLLRPANAVTPYDVNINQLVCADSGSLAGLRWERTLRRKAAQSSRFPGRRAGNGAARHREPDRDHSAFFLGKTWAYAAERPPLPVERRVGRPPA